MSPRIWMSAVLAMLMAPAHAQDLRPLPPPAPPQITMPRLIAPEAKVPVSLASLGVEVSVAGSEAAITYDLVFRNSNDRVLEGTLDFPLADGQQVTGFALDFNGQMRDAVAVGKAKGRAVFEAIERRQVDPGLLEQTAGQHYTLRVYPIPANGTRRVRITVSQQAQAVGGVLSLPLDLRMAQGASIPVSLRVDGLKDARLSGLLGDAGRPGRRAITLAPALLGRNATPLLQWRASDVAPVLLQRSDQGVHAVADVILKGKATTRTTHHLTLLWDASMSGQHRGLSQELAVLERWFALNGDLRVTLIVLRDKPEAARTFDLGAGQWRDLRAVLQEMTYDGASNPGGWTLPSGSDHVLYVGDGLFNYGASTLPPMPADVPFDALVSGDADLPRLRALAHARGGRVISIHGVEDIDAAALALRQRPPHISRVEALGATDAIASSPWADVQGHVRLAARVTDPGARLTVHWQDADGAHATPVALEGQPEEGRLAGRLWARAKIDALEADPQGNRAALERLGQQFGILNAHTSLIVLEAAADYVRYDIPAPAGMEADVALAAKQRDRERSDARRRHRDSLLQRWDERAAWWAHRWPKNSPPKPKVSGNGSRQYSRRGELDSVAVTGAVAPPPPPAPMAMAAPVMQQEMMADAAAKESPIGNARSTDATIRIQPWSSDSPVARRLREVSADRVYATYLDARGDQANSPAFFLDAAAVLKQRGQPELALRVLSNLAELRIEDRHLLRVLAYRLIEDGAVEQALPILERVAQLAEEEPQSARDLGLALQMASKPQQAADALYRVVDGDWDDRFSDIDLIALAELNALIARHPGQIDTSAYDARLLRNLPVGLRTVLTWDMDNSDMDLWVTDPNGEKAYYGHRRTYQGGRMSDDFTGGYGPEEFVLRDPKPGKYKVEANYYGSRAQIVTGEPTLQLWFSTAFGTPMQKDQRVTIRLKGTRDTVFVGEFEVK